MDIATPPSDRPQPAISQRARANGWSAQRITDVSVWAENLWSVRVSKPEGFVFTPGHYAKLGLPVIAASADQVPDTLPDQGPVWRAYSIVSSPGEDILEFLVTLVPGGAMSDLLRGAQPGAAVMVESAAMGFFIASQLAQGETLWMLSTGSGVGPYVSMLREGSVLQRYRKVVVVHSVRTAAELAYADEFRALAERHEDVVRYVPVVTREAGRTSLSARIPQLVDSGELEDYVGLRLDVATARTMVCGNPEFAAQMRRLLTARSFQPCRRGLIGSMLFENYW